MHGKWGARQLVGSLEFIKSINYFIQKINSNKNSQCPVGNIFKKMIWKPNHGAPPP